VSTSPASQVKPGAQWPNRADEALRALANPALRRALELVAAHEVSSGELADACGWTRPAASQNLRVLREAELVEVRVDGNRRLYRARAERLAALRAHLDDFWATRLRALAAASAEPGGPGKATSRVSSRKAGK
jgi:DNA-binding transcriptional ArsR family regulator